MISFVVPCYNYARFLPECLDSILKLEGPFDWEIVLIDDASTDNTREIIETFSDCRLRVITHAVNRGHGFTINEGLQAARGDFIARIDPDDRYRPGFLTTLVPRFDRSPEVGLVYGDAALIDEQGRVTAERSDREHGGRDFTGNELVRLLERNFICAPAVIARREAWLGVPPVPEHLAFNDWYFTVMMARKHEFCYVDEVVAEYRVHATNHHRLITRQRREEPSIFWVLEHVFGTPEVSGSLESAKQAARRRIHGAHYLELGDKYFGARLDEDARRCYLQALRYMPGYAARADVLRRLLATMVGRRTYEWSKALVKKAAGREEP